MPINGKTDFVGPARAKFMMGISASEKATKLNDAIVEANMKSLYGDRFQMPEDDMNVGGDVIYPTPIVIQPPRSNAGLIVAIVFLSVLTLALLAGGAWLYLRSVSPPPIQPPPPASSGDDYDAQLFDP